MPTCRVAAISGSLRPGSHTTAALRIALRGAEREGATTDLIELGPLDLPFVAGREASGPGVEELRRRVGEARGILLGTPEYHGSFSGVLKNALDLMGWEEFEGKMIGLVGVAGGGMGGHHALQTLRTVARSLHAWAVPQEVSVPRVSGAFDERGELRDRHLTQRLEDLGAQVTKYALLHDVPERAFEFLKQWECAPENPGGVHG